MTKTWTWALACVLLSGAAMAEALEVPNPSFEEGGDGPVGWRLSSGEGAWIAAAGEGKRAISVTGTGEPDNNNFWRSDSLPLRPGAVYRLQFLAKQVEGSGGCPTSGPVFCNRDLGGLPGKWTEYTSVFVTPGAADPDAMWMRFGQWEINGTVAYDNVRLMEAQPVYVTEDGVTLGEGESISGREYAFKAPLKTASFNHSRPLARLGCYFNSYRLVFGATSEVVYRHQVGSSRQTAAHVDVGIGHYTGGELLVEASTDGVSWAEIATLAEVGNVEADIPAGLLPAEAVWVRLSSRTSRALGEDSDPGSFQVYTYTYGATLDTELGDLRGKTRFVATPGTDPRLKVTIETFGDAVPGGNNVLVARVENTSGETIKGSPSLTLTPAGGWASRTAIEAVFAPGVQEEVRIPYEVAATGSIDVEFALGDGIAFKAETAFEIPHLYDSSYGEVLPGSSGAVGLWWGSSGWKVSRTRAMPTRTGNAVRIQAARNEAEAAQFVVRPAEAMTGFTATSEALAGPGGAAIPVGNVELLRVRYVPVTVPTDNVGVAAPWPDPLPPFQEPIDIAAMSNQPVWVRVKVPSGVPAGFYKGLIHITANGYAAEVPLEVTVFDFDLPDRMTCTTAFGFSASLAFRYHGVEGAQQREVYDKYLATLSAHHISPYTPTALDPIRATWPGTDEWDGGLRDRGVKHGGEAALILVDDSTKKSASAVYGEFVRIPGKGIKLRFWYRTKEPDQDLQVTLMHHGANGQWMYGKNNDIRVKGDGEWQLFERTIGEFPEAAETFKLRLWAAPYATDDSTMGTVWYDDLIVTDAGTGDSLLDGGFEPPAAEDLTPAFDWTAWDAAMERAIGHYHFNTFRLPLPGLGGGTFHSRHEPSLLGYGEDTPEYKTAFSAYCRAVQEHLREKGWLDEAFVYWFDEPDPKDYEFVTNGFRKLKEAAPDIGRMLTEQVEPGLVGGPNIWCPLTPSFDLEVAEQRRAQGEKFWWYICTGPKAPFVTLFIDHPGTELRVWLWQTWKRRISGLLIWETNYWTSDAAYPDPSNPQNPYEDPMGWRTGYSTPPGTKAPWGNGDGRFIYPPEAAADGRPGQPVLDAPVDSIRFEMLRDGIEDYEYLVMLDRLIRETGDTRYEGLLDVPGDISVDLTHFTTDPAPIESRREAIARAIEELEPSTKWEVTVIK